MLHLVAQQPRYGNAIYPLLALLEREGFIKGAWEDPDKRTVRVYTITSRGHDEVTRINTIVSPKLEETITILQELLSDLQSPSSDTPASITAGGEDSAPIDTEIP